MKVFKESQRFSQWWLLLIEVVVLGMVFFSFYEAYQQFSSGGSNESLISSTISVIIAVLAISFIHSIKLSTRIDEKGISYQFFPVHLKPKVVLWEELSQCTIRKYSAITEYGGWGIRGISRRSVFGVGSRGRAYNIKGNMGIQLEFNDGGKLLIGTQNSDTAGLTIKNYIHKVGAAHTTG